MKLTTSLSLTKTCLITLCASLAFFILIGCDDDPITAPKVIVPLRVEVWCATSTIWAGDSVCFTAKPNNFLDDQYEFLWIFSASKFKADSIRTKKNCVKAYFSIPQNTTVSVQAIRNGAEEARAYTTVMVKQPTGKLTIFTCANTWDAGVPLRMSAIYEGPVPFGSRVEWEMESASIVAPATDTVSYTFRDVRMHAISATLIAGPSDSVIARTSTLVHIQPYTFGRYISFSMTGLVRSRRKSVVLQSGEPFYVTKETPLVLQKQGILRWNGSCFTLDDRISETETITIHGMMRGTAIDTIRGTVLGPAIDTIRITYTKKEKNGAGNSYSISLRGIPRSSSTAGLWEARGTVCGAALKDYYENITTVHEYTTRDLEVVPYFPYFVYVTHYHKSTSEEEFKIFEAKSDAVIQLTLTH